MHPRSSKFPWMVQVSTIFFYEKLVDHRANSIQIKQKMVSIRSCGLHIIHGAFKHAFEKTSWKMKGILKGSFAILYYTFM